MSDLVLVEPGPISVLRLNNPPLNLVSLELTTQLETALEDLAGDEELRAVVVAGNDRSFSAGSDIKEFESLHGRAVEMKSQREGAVYTALAQLPVPTLAALEGNAFGGGLELALCCDLRVASETVHLGLPETALGVIPGSGGTQRLPRLVGSSVAKEIIFLGEPIDARRAHEIGLVNRVVPQGEAEKVALEMAAAIAKRGPLATREAKRVIDGGAGLSLSDGLGLEMSGTDRVFSSDEMLEGAKAFFEKREPDF
ncbi:MAG TPA: enoyl-CoA hydratase-related protein [Acidimicrobiia bacterium]|nr:enoyl-CoA hydratase-related protein [Acidimicrobiia bacterium]